MSGDEQKRYCDKCQHHVHDLTGLSLEEIDILRTKHKGRLCGAFRLGTTAAIGASILTLAACSAPDNDSIVIGEHIPPAKEAAAETKATKSIGTKTAKTSEAEPTPKKKIPRPEETKPDIEHPMILGMICPPDAPESPARED